MQSHVYYLSILAAAIVYCPHSYAMEQEPKEGVPSFQELIKPLLEKHPELTFPMAQTIIHEALQKNAQVANNVSQPSTTLAQTKPEKTRKNISGEIFLYKCPHCKKGFHHNSNLLRHLEGHAEYPLKCSVPGCFKVYRHKTSLEKHLDKHRTLTIQEKALSLARMSSPMGTELNFN